MMFDHFKLKIFQINQMLTEFQRHFSIESKTPHPPLRYLGY